MTLLIATSNPGKLREMRALLAAPGIELTDLRDFPGIPEPEETGASYWENARIKALAYAQATGATAIADDSGIEIAALGGAPGVHSARYLGAGTPYDTRFAEIFRRLGPGQTRDARFVAAIAVARGREVLFETEAWVDGIVADAPSGENGFGYDPIFFYPPFGKTMAACNDIEKGIVSHRGRALRNVARWLTTRESLRLRT